MFSNKTPVHPIHNNELFTREEEEENHLVNTISQQESLIQELKLSLEDSDHRQNANEELEHRFAEMQAAYSIKDSQLKDSLTANQNLQHEMYNLRLHYDHIVNLSKQDQTSVDQQQQQNYSSATSSTTSSSQQLEDRLSSLQVELNTYQDRCNSYSTELIESKQKANNECQHLSAELETANSMIQRLHEQLTLKQGTLSNLDLVLATSETQHNDHQNQMARAIKRYEDAEVQIIVLKDELEMSKSRCSDLDAELDELEKNAQQTYDANQVILSKANEDNVKLTRQISEIAHSSSNQSSPARSSHDTDNLQGKIDVLTKEIQQRDSAFVNIERQLNKERCDFERRYEDMSLEIETGQISLRQQIAEKNDRIKELENQSGESTLNTNSQLLQLQNMLRTKEQEMLTLQQHYQVQLNSLMSKSKTSEQQLSSLQSEHSTLNEQFEQAKKDKERCLEDSKREVDKELTQAKQQLSKNRKEFLKMQDYTSDLKAKMKQMEMSRGQLVSLLSDRDDRIVQLDDKVKLLKDKYHNIHDDYDDLDDKLQELKLDYDALKDKQCRQENDLGDLAKEKADLLEMHKKEIKEIKLSHQKDCLTIKSDKNKFEEMYLDQKKNASSIREKLISDNQQSAIKEQQLSDEIDKLRLICQDARKRHMSECSDNPDDIQELKDEIVDLSANRRAAEIQLKQCRGQLQVSSEQLQTALAEAAKSREQHEQALEQEVRLRQQSEEESVKLKQLFEDTKSEFTSTLELERAKHKDIKENLEASKIENRAQDRKFSDVQMEYDAKSKKLDNKLSETTEKHQEEINELKKNHLDQLLRERTEIERTSSQLTREKLSRMNEKISLEVASAVDETKADFVIEKNVLLLSLEDVRNKLKIVTSEKECLMSKESALLQQSSPVSKKELQPQAEVHSPRTKSRNEENLKEKIKQLEVNLAAKDKMLKVRQDEFESEISELKYQLLKSQNMETNSSSLHAELSNAQVNIQLEHEELLNPKMTLMNKLKRMCYKDSLSLPNRSMSLPWRMSPKIVFNVYQIILHVIVLFYFVTLW